METGTADTSPGTLGGTRIHGHRGTAAVGRQVRLRDRRSSALPIFILLGCGACLPFAGAASDNRTPEYPYSGPPAPAAKPMQVLILTGADHPAHVWRATTPVIASALREDPRADVRVVEDAHFMDSAALARYQVVVLHYMNWRTPAPGAGARENLQRFVERGGGLVLVHFACGTWLDWAQFGSLAGRVWNPKRRGHDPRGPFRVTIVRTNHPITRGLESFETDDELYTCLDGDTPIEILATAKSKVDGKEHPMAFVLTVGKGRVFHSPLGHDVKAFGPSTLELFRRGVAWAAGFPPDANASTGSGPGAGGAGGRE